MAPVAWAKQLPSLFSYPQSHALITERSRQEAGFHHPWEILRRKDYLDHQPTDFDR